ncbi:ASCH domain-containing protein [Alteromonas australica]|uniref:ASCH domain-containing protein n=1 Tax=Alteromonas australica TaxID=589873 RepID=UPI0035C80628
MQKISSKRFFLPLSSLPYAWFTSGAKNWEFRKLKGGFNTNQLYPGRYVEVRRGYNSKDSFYGKIKKVLTDTSVERLVSKIGYQKIIPTASSQGEAIESICGILNLSGNEQEFIAFEIEGPLQTIKLAGSLKEKVELGLKTSTIRRGVRDITLGPGIIVSSNEVIPVEITNSYTKPFSECGPSEVIRDGFTDKSKLLETLRDFYTDFDEEELVTIISFEKDVK